MSNPPQYFYPRVITHVHIKGDQLKEQHSQYVHSCARHGWQVCGIDCWDGNDGEPIIYHGHTSLRGFCLGMSFER